MNFKNILRMQKALDASIEKTHDVDRKKIIDKKIVALLVELGEFANEYAPFKYWKKNKNIKRELVVEEFVDGIHFFISLADTAGCEEELIIEPKLVETEDMSQQLLMTYKLVAGLWDDFSVNKIKEAFCYYLGNAKLLDLSEEEIEKFYIDKNKVNFERIANEY